MPEFWILLLAFGAAGRTTRLITGDTITRWFRDAVARRYGDESIQREFVGCPWCIGFWVCGLFTLLAFCPVVAHHPAFLIATTALSMSWLVALAANNLDRH